MSARKLRSSALLILWLAAGCATPLVAPRQPLREDAQRAVDRLRARWKEFSDVRAQADVLVQRGDTKHQIPGVLLLKPPGSLRFEALSPFGQPLLIATMHEGQIVAYDVGAHTATVGAATPSMAARHFGLAITPEDLVGLLAGFPVPPSDLRVAEIFAPDEHGRSLEMTGVLHRQRVWMDFDTGVVRRVLVTGAWVDALLVYERAEDGTVVGIEVSAAQENVTGRVRYQNVSVNSGIERERFLFTIPPGAAVERLR